ncbi:CheR family methyltransferase [Chlorogloeopsis sp. ULAP02]|uniref:CheR family methyltransferase n=1 Tax=Chlorogloeopsis sp. ULAP02 TaxID=3107926 RepID=UPI00313573B7
MSTSEVNPEFEALLHYLKQNCGCDLTGYKPDSLMRRFQRRMQQLGIENYTSYLQYLQAEPQECTPLLDTILINFSGFFRDRDAWEYLAHKIIPQIITNKQPQEQIRVWSAGCASGEEVYTLVMLLAEILGIEQYLQRVQMFATDVDRDALRRARQGIYNENEVASIPSQLLSKYFEQTEQGYVFCSQLRRSIIFGRHNLAVDAPMSKIDLLVCRNVLIYLKRETQASIFVRFHFALNNQGLLFLGNSESLINQRQIFTPVSIKRRIFAKAKDQKLGLDEHLLLLPQTQDKKAINPLNTYIRIWQAAFETSPLAQLVVDRSGSLLLVNERAYGLFRLQNNHIGAPVRDLEIGQVINSLTVMRRLNRDHHPFSLKNIEWVTDNATTHLDIHITPISDSSGKLIGANLTFIDVTQYIYLKDEFESLNSTLTSLTQELHITRKVLNSTTQELRNIH